MKEELYQYLVSQGEGLLTVNDIIFNMVAAAILGGLIYMTYRVTHSGTVYSARFNVSLIMTAMVTTMVMCVIGNNISLSLGMVGALSIVRFRTAIKDPRDTIYLFWAVGIGVCCGVSHYLIALIGTVTIFLFLVLFGFVRDVNRMVIIVRGDASGLNSTVNFLDSFLMGKGVKRVFSLNSNQKGEVIFEVSQTVLNKCEKKNGHIEEKLNEIEGVDSVCVMCQEDEISG